MRENRINQNEIYKYMVYPAPSKKKTSESEEAKVFIPFLPHRCTPEV